MRAGAAAGSSNRAFSEKWERPSWLVYWSDGRTLQVLMDLAAALGRYRVGGAPLPFERLRFTRGSFAAVQVAR